VVHLNPHKLLHNRFLPVSSPEYIQLDVTNKCNIKCIYCNVQGEYNLEKGDMKLSIAESLFKELRDIGWNKVIREFRPFMNGDPLMMSTDKLNGFLSLGRKYLGSAKNVIYTNGANSSKSRMFLTPLLDEVHLTVSASTPDTYTKIHGVSLFYEVLKTYRMLIKNNKKTFVHFIYNKLNEDELDEWRIIFKDAIQNISPLHYSDNQPNSLKILDNENITKGYEIGTTANPDILYFWHPCNCWNSLSISYKGEYMQCPDSHYKYNYGIVGEIPLKKAWMDRADNKLKCDACINCNLKNKRQKMISYITSKWVKLF
jgi:MoaA/NifB/PqqE/SkfB family radical SAM enzyme